MARDHTRVNIDIWGDDDFRDLPVDAQNLYWFLWTSPDRTYCGGHWWHAGKLTQYAQDWTIGRIEAAGAVLSQRLFLVIDEPVEECLLRSWIKHDGLCKVPNMAVSMANARASMASKACRGVVVHEVKKLAARYPDLSSWKRTEVANLLSQKAIDAATLPPFTPRPTPPSTPPPTPDVTPPLTLNGGVGVNPPDNPAPTTATPTPTATEGGYLSTEGHQSPAKPPRPQCNRHPHENSREKCDDCRRRREWDEAEAGRIAADEVAARRTRREAIDACELCDKNGIRDFGDFTGRCTHPENPPHLQEVG